MTTNRRDLIRMTDVDLATFIEEQKSLQVACRVWDDQVRLISVDAYRVIRGFW